MQKYCYIKSRINHAMWLACWETSRKYMPAGTTFDAAVIFQCDAENIAQADNMFAAYHGMRAEKYPDIGVMIIGGCNRLPIHSAEYLLTR